jgi:UDP-N-acetylglucosamine 3-dehydrogenase
LEIDLIQTWIVKEGYWVHTVAIWGAGTMGRVHAKRYAMTGEAQLKYIIDNDLEKATRLAQPFDAVATVDPGPAVRDPQVDVIDVCLPTYLHRESVELAAGHGKHVFCEKPIALTLDDANAMISTCKSNGVRLGIAHVVRYFPEYEMARDMIASGRLGRVGVVRLSRTGPFPGGWNDWYADPQLSKGLFVDLSIHDFDFLNWCFGPVERICARKVATSRPLEYGLATLRMESGVIAHVEGSWAHPRPFSYKFEISGSEGMIECDSAKTKPLTLLTLAQPSSDCSKNEKAREGGPEAGLGVATSESPLRERDPYLREIQDFLAYVRGERLPRVLPEDAVAALEVSLAATRSADLGEAVKVR